MTEAEAKAYMEEHSSDSYQLVDVRQPAEYEEYHLPGALLVPLNVLTSGGGKLDPEKPTIVYCRSGGRSQAASQYLASQGFDEVFDIGSNIASWMGIQVAGDYSRNLDLVRPDAEFPDAWVLAYALEEGLQRFYYALMEAESREKFKELYKKLAGFEDLHKDRLKTAYLGQNTDQIDLDGYLKEHPDLIEGGELNKYSPFNIISRLNDIMDVFSLSMAVEAQSQDLYFRLANQRTDNETRQLFLDLADEEKMHLSYLAEEMNDYLESKD